ncbi:antibiotic biosynthesis monooxygenase [Mucilaginibacter sp. JRF]|uniref:putative quinol monooxygenase n=1 Tax=Mucilaginibacter sp. JRF TaxID=2780088 RepID=UPI00187FDBDD|nr:putative quinol monooxygenase [Mucilaginibacter sp. JRF]MBE9583380.1 antibiotic biosynthesis monooxygenase [Mucilaginibacter sp. JRF]
MDTAIIHVFAKWKVKTEHIGIVLQLLPELTTQSTAEEGNIYYHIYQDRSEPDVIVLSEAYRDEAAITAHRESAYYQDIVVKQIVPLLEDRQVTLTRQIL